jgi:hypothetical protein
LTTPASRLTLMSPVPAKPKPQGTLMLRTVIASCAVLVLAALAAPPAPAQTLFEGARVIPGDGSAAIENAAFLVEGGVITRIGRRGEIAAPAAAIRVDLGGKTVRPGRGRLCRHRL